MHFIVVKQIVIGAEVTNLDAGTSYELLWLRVKSQQGSPFEKFPVEQMQLFDQTRSSLFQIGDGHTLALACASAKGFDGVFGKVANSDVWHRHAIPGTALLAQQELVERSPFQFLPGAAGSNIVFALVVNRVRIGIDMNFEQIFACFGGMPYPRHDSQHITNFVGEVFQQLPGIRHTDNYTIIVASDNQHATFSISEPAKPFQVFVPPGRFPFGELVFRHTSRPPDQQFLHHALLDLPSLRQIHL